MSAATGTMMFSLVLFLLHVAVWPSAQGQSARGRASSTCRRCEDQPEECRRLAGLYTVTVLKHGSYNPVVEIPAQACSINITELAPSKNYLAVRTEEGDNIVNSLWSVGSTGTFRGAGTVFEHNRGVRDCPGECITAPGPTNRKVIVQLFSKSKNPGIAYSFVLPKEVPFNPFGQSARQLPRSSSSSSSSSSASSSPRLIPRQRGAVGESDLRAEREQEPYIGGGRQSSLTPQEQEPRGRVVNPGERSSVASSGSAKREEDEKLSGSYHGSSYGSHTLGGRGQSYTYQYTDDSDNDDDEYDRDNDNVKDLPTSGGRGSGRRYGSDRSSSSGARSGIGYESAGGSRRSYGSSSSGSSGSSNSGRGSSYYQRSYNRRPSRVGEQLSSSSSRRQQTRQTYGSGNYGNDLSRGYQISASSSRGGLVDRTYSRSVEPNNRLQTFERPLEQRPAFSIGRGPGGNEYEWTISGLSQCSLTCGGGTQETEVVCVLTSSATQVVVTPDNCQNALKPRIQRVACNNMPCPPGWVTGEWSECSATCGGGTQTRRIECRQRFSAALDISVSASQCQLPSKPAVSQQCNTDPCSMWKAGEWGQCSESCGGGERTRDVECVDGQGIQIPSIYCSQDKPAATEQCNSQSCESQWWHTSWSDKCSAVCGWGVTSRHVMCADRSGGSVSEDACDREKRPHDSQRCQSSAGCGTVWFTGPWSQCSDSCSQPVRTRQVICVRRVGGHGGRNRLVGDEQCPQDSKPPSEEACHTSGCASQYYVTAWGQCSVTCGRGVKTREVRCLSRETGQPSSSCDHANEPHKQETCRLNPCATHQAEMGRPVSQSRPSSPQSRPTSPSRPASPHGRPSAPSRPSPSRPSPSRPSDDKCKDTFWNCRIVVQARLCHYTYYHSVCCISCRKI